ncbi:TBC1 domain family member 5 [Tolypocladium paradoxum]|uniref:TBC1 domain family member 5 n=1 Tax=Tolypocladium paradoxum TaxID=94208 RepID=A0A2S4KV21_9HYPO|nr:TBC1 domain family member 5 [Tolypocladium paradoxum]
MRSLEETQARWQATKSHSSSVADLQRAVKANGPASPCLSGCRSVCWKTFLLSTEGSGVSWARVVGDGREDYGNRREHFLRFIEHPEALTELTVDPLADDPESPWNTVRQDEVIRAEIQQDVRRLPDEANYHEDRIQSMILNILFVYCKVNPNRGGYRQGMHELLAPIVHVIDQDAVDRAVPGHGSSLDESMLEILDSSFIEHDAYVLFSRLMEHAQVFYEVKDASEPSTATQSSSGYQEQRSAIVERSKFIHDVCLQKMDEDLASHLTSIEILPQIFLIRWIRLLFSREFPFNQFLVLWDTIFAVDPSLDLIDLICCAMLIRIRWQLLEADYSVCLQLLLKYPPPAPLHGPHTFVDDAVYLRDHMNASGGAALIMKYTGKMPEPPGSSQRPHPSTANPQRLNSLRQRGFGGRSPLPSPSRFIQQQSGVESLFQGAAKSAKGVLERGEKLGINQAVREAMTEIRRNMQSFNESRPSPRTTRNMLGEDGAAKALVAMERRNKQLASLLDETVTNLKTVSMTNLDDRAKSLELIEIAAAKIQFVQVYLGDSSMEVPSFNAPAAEEAAAEESAKAADEKSKEEDPDVEVEEDPATGEPAPSKTVAADVSKLSLTDDKPPPPKKDEAVTSPNSTQRATEKEEDNTKEDPLSNTPVVLRPSAPNPARSTLAQSSFSWMLEPDESATTRTPSSASKSPLTQHKKRLSNNASRERNAFLFGEAMAEAPQKADDIFGMEPIQRSKNRSVIDP